MIANQTIDYDPEVNYVIPIWRQILWVAIFAIIPIVGATGNFIVFWIIVAHKNMRTVTNLFIVNLAISDGLVAAFDVPVVCYEMIYSDWPFGYTYCKLNEGLAAINICVSMLMMSMISIERFFAIMYPFRTRLKEKRPTILFIVVIWCISLLFTSPNWIYATVTVRSIRAGREITHWCSPVWPVRDAELIYRTVFMVVTFLIPLICMSYTYSKVARKLWGSKWIGENTVGRVKNIRSKKKIVKMLIIVVVTFTVCWLPFQLLFLIIASGIIHHEPVYIREIYLVAFWFSMSHSMYNPIIYCWMNAKFRTGFRRALKCCPFVRYDQVCYLVHFSSNKST